MVPGKFLYSRIRKFYRRIVKSQVAGKFSTTRQYNILELMKYIFNTQNF